MTSPSSAGTGADMTATTWRTGKAGARGCGYRKRAKMGTEMARTAPAIK